MDGDVKWCPSCQESKPHGVSFCDDCGSKLENQSPVKKKWCPGCKERKSGLSKFCGDCGRKLEDEPTVKNWCSVCKEIVQTKFCAKCGSRPVAVVGSNETGKIMT